MTAHDPVAVRPLRRTAVTALLVVTAAIAAACGSSAPTGATAATATSGPSATAAASTPASVAPPSPSASPTPSSAASAPAAAASLPLNGRIAVADKGFALTLPSEWTRVDLGANGFSDLMKAVGSQLPAGLQQTMSSQIGQMAAAGVSLYAFRTPAPGIAPGSSLNVLVLPNVGVTLDTFESLAVGQLKAQLGADTDVATSRVSAPVGELLRLSYQLKVGTGSVGTVQYIFLAPDRQFVISCGSPGDATAVAVECESIAKTLEIL